MSGKFLGKNNPVCAGGEGLYLCGTEEYTATGSNNAVILHVFLGSGRANTLAKMILEIFSKKYYLGQVSQYWWDTLQAFIREFFVPKILHGHGDSDEM